LPTVLIYIVFAIGGAAALIYEVMWMRSFSLVFGSSTRSAAAVLAAYFMGMALGNWLGGRLCRRGHGLVLYGACEIVIGLTALLVGPWLALYSDLYPSFYDSLRDSPLLLGGLKLLLAAVSLGPPVIAMGATLPFIVSAMVTQEGKFAGRAGLLYSLNTLGATVGAVVGALLLPWSLGVQNSIYLAVAINIAVGITAITIGRRLAAAGVNAPAQATSTSSPTPATTAPARPPFSILAAAAISGMGTLSLEVLHVRLISHRSDSSIYVFGLLLGVYLVFLSLGCMIVTRFLDRGRPWRILAWTQSLGVVAILLSPIVLQQIPEAYFYAGGGAFSSHLWRLAGAMIAVLGPPVLLMGMVLPATWKLATTSLAEAGYRVGTLTSVNTLSAVAGSLLAGFVLLPIFGVSGGILVIGLLYAGLAAMAFKKGYPGTVLRYAGAGCGVLALVWAASGVWRLELQKLGEGEKIIRYDEGEGASLAVIERPDGHRRMVINDRYTLGASGSLDRELRQGRLPLLLHPHPRSVAYIGIATGITVSAFLDFPSVEKCVGIELLPSVVDAMPDFAPWHRGFTEHPRAEVIVDDGRNYLAGTTQMFDVIVGDLFAPWNAGVAYLYTVEQFESVRRRLEPGGVFVQWLPGHQLAVEDARVIAASFLRVFPAAALWRVDLDVSTPVIALVGYRDGLRFDGPAVDAHIQRIAAIKNPGDTLLSTRGGVKMLYVCGPDKLAAWAEGAPVNTDDRPIIEYSTSRHLQERGVRSFSGATTAWLASLRPRTWDYPRDTADRSAESAALADRTLQAVITGADHVLDARIAAAQRQLDQVVEHLAAAVPLVGGVTYVADLTVAVATELYQIGSTQQAEQLLRLLCTHAPRPTTAWAALAIIRAEAGDRGDAIDLLTRAVEAEPEEIPLRTGLVELLRNERRYVEAEPHQRKLVSTTPNDGRLRADLAQTLHILGRVDEARKEVEHIVSQADPRTRDAQLAYLRSLGLSNYVNAKP
jgi:spermidine synthase